MQLTFEPRLTPELARRLDAFLPECPNAHFTQHPGWTTLPAEDPRGEWGVLLGEGASGLEAAALVRSRRVPLLGDTLVDIFRGPAAVSAEAWLLAVAGLPNVLAALRPLALRVDPHWSGPGAERIASGLRDLGYMPMAEAPWSARSLETPIDTPPEEFLQTFRGNTRRDVQKALRLEIETREDLDDDGVRSFHALYETMVGRKGAEAKSLGFFLGLRDLFRAWPGRGLLISSWQGGELLGAIAVFTVGPRALYAYGASTAAHPALPKNHILQYRAMCRSRELGCTLYDMGGFSAGVGEPDRRTPVQKINFFKAGFGGRVVDFVPAHERVLKPGLLGLLRRVERWRRGPA